MEAGQGIDPRRMRMPGTPTMKQEPLSPTEDIPPTPVHPPSHLQKSATVSAASDTIESAISPAMSDEDLEGVSSKSWQAQDVPSPAGSAKSDSEQERFLMEGEGTGEPGIGMSETPSMPVQKRRRVTRACDECRRKKIKCDGKQPCTHCSVYSYECTYDKPSNRRRNPAPQYIEALENRLQRAEALLRKFMPDVDLGDPSLDPAVQQEFQNRERARVQAAKLKREGGQQADNQGEQIMSMIETIGQLDLTEGGEWDFHGISSGAVFLKRMKEHFGGMLGHDYRGPLFSRPPKPPGLFSLDSPRSSTSSPWDSALPNIYNLPPKKHARALCEFALHCATCLLRIIHIPTFNESFDRIYEKTPESFGVEDHRFLSLLYAVMALGCMYNIPEEDSGIAGPVNYKAAMDEGLKYYSTARLLMQDITECRDLTSLQALVYLILFLQATSNLASCYSFIGIALRAALRMGLHRHLPHAKLTPIEHESRRRVFYVIRQMDTYISALLGFPILLRDEDIDQPMPTEVDDEYITKDRIITPPAGTPSFFQACNAYSRLMDIMAKVIKYIYPLKGIEECVTSGEGPSTTYMISYAKIKEIECDLKKWNEQLPSQWRPSPDGPIEVIRVRTLLRFSYAHVQMMLYRPFLQYVSPRICAGKNVDERYFACAAAGINISRNIVHIGIEIRKQAVLIGPYWYILYTEFFAILSLVFYALENPDKPGSSDMLREATAGRDVIASLSQRSMAADRVSVALDALFEQLPDRIQKGKARPGPTRKRSAPGPKPSPVQAPNQPPTGPQARRSDEMNRPLSVPNQDQLRQMQHRMTLDTSQRQANGRLGQQFVSNFSDLLPLDMSSATGSPESNGTPSGSHRGAAGFQAHQPPSAGANPIYKLDAMMFPSGDPFAYPNQPIMEFSLGTQAGHPSSGQQHQDSMQFYTPNVYDDIEGQLLGPIPPYLMQSAQGQSIDLAAQMYHNTSNLLNLAQQPQAHNAQQAAAHQRHQREIEEMLVDPNIHDVFGSHHYRQL